MDQAFARMSAPMDTLSGIDHALEDPRLPESAALAERLIEVLETVQQVLKRTARMNTRKKHPNTYQLLLALTTEPAQA